MPIYEYECTECKERFERFQSVHDAPVKTCPECHGPTRRVFHPVGIIFKGSGFYVTDNRKSSTSSASGGSNGSTGSNTGSDQKGEAPAKAGGDEKAAANSGAADKP